MPTYVSRLHAVSYPRHRTFLLPLVILLILSSLLASAPWISPHTVQAASVAGYALSFGDSTGSDDFVEILNESGKLPSGNAARTLEFWAKSFDKTGQDLSLSHNSDHMVNYGEATDNHAFGAMLYIGNTWWFYAHNKDVNDIDTDVPADTRWHFHAINYDGSTVRYYLDGDLIKSDSRKLETVSDNLFFGIRPDRDFGNIFNGLLDEVRLWNVALSQSEIKADMHIKLTGNELGLVGYWNFDENGGQFIRDSSSNHLDGWRGSTDVEDANDPTWVESDAPIDPPRSVHTKKIIVFLQGVCSELKAGISTNAKNTPFADLQQLLQKEYRYGKDDFLLYSYKGGVVDTSNGVWYHNAYDKLDPVRQDFSTTSVDVLHDQLLVPYHALHPDTTFILIGHSLGGMVAFGEAARKVTAPDYQHGLVSTIITVDSPLHGVTPEVAQLGALIPFYSCISQGISAGKIIGLHNNEPQTTQKLQQVANEARQKEIRIVNIGNTVDCLWEPAWCGYPLIIGNADSTQWIFNSEADTRVFSIFTTCRNLLQFPVGKCIADSHSAVLSKKFAPDALHTIADFVGKQN